MAVKNTDCAEHTKEIINLKKDMESVLRHEKKFTQSIDNLELIIADLKLTITLFNERFKDLPTKVRTLEDKSKSKEIVDKVGWLIIGALISVLIYQTVITIKETHKYEVTRSK